MLAATKLSSVALCIATRLLTRQKCTQNLSESPLSFFLVCCPKAVTMNVQFSHAVGFVAVEIKTLSIFINSKVWTRNDAMCRWVRASNYGVRFCLSCSVLCSVSEQPNIFITQHKVLNRLQSLFVTQMDNPGFQPTTVWSKWQSYHEICTNGCYKCTKRRLLMTYQQNMCSGIELFNEVLISVEQAGWMA